MTNNDTGKTGNYHNIVYDSIHDTNNGRKRIAVSATEVELLSDIPFSTDSGITNTENNGSNPVHRYNTQTLTSPIDKQQQQNNYQTLSVNRGQLKPTVIYKDENDQELGSAVDRLLDKYAPDANPHKLSDISNNRQPPSKVNVVTARDEPSISTFQTNAPPTTTASHNYSTIIRPNTGQTSQTQPQMNPYNNTNNERKQHTRPVSSYDSFQHVIPPTQQQQQQPPQASVSVKTKNGNVAVVPGKLYTIGDDPLYILYDRQNIIPQNMIPKNTPKSASTTTFQPSSNFQTDPLSVLYTDASQRYPKQSVPLTTDTNLDGSQTFDLGNLIKRVQADYFREIQPYVTSVRFVEKDREFGQGIDDIGFTTPVTVGKGFTGQADDILRRSFGRPNASQPPVNLSDHKDQVPGNNINQRHPPNQHPPLIEKFDSKQSFTSVTSVSISTDGSDYDEDYPIGNDRKKKVEVHSQGTSPPPRLKQTKAQSQIQNPPVGSVNISSKLAPKHGSDDEEETTTTTTVRPVVPKLAKRISSDKRSISSAGSVTSDDHEEYSATYNEHEHPNNSRAPQTEIIPALVKNSPLVKPGDEATRERIIKGNQGVQRSEDIHPTPPTIRPRERSSRPISVKSESEKSDSVLSGSENVSDSDDGSKSAAYNEHPPASTTARSNVPQVPYSVPGGRDSNPPQTTSSIPGGRDGNPPQSNARAPAGRDTNPPQATSTIPAGRDTIPPQATSTIPGGRDTNPPQATSTIPGGRNTNPPQATSTIPGGRNTNPPQATSTIPGGRDTNPPQATSTIPGGRDTNPPQATSTIPGGRDTNPPQATSTIPGGRDTNPPQATSTIPGGRNTNPPQATSTIPGGRDTNPPQATSTIPGGRDTNPPQATSTIPGGRNTNPPQAASTIPGGRDTNPPSTARTTTETNARQPVPSGANPNIHFVPPDQRNAANDRNPQAATSASVSTGATAQTGSTRFFRSNTDPKYGGRRSVKDDPGSIGNKIKSFFRRKKSE